MYYTSKLIKLNSRIASYLELVKDANKRYVNKTSEIESANKTLAHLLPYNYRWNVQYRDRMKELSSWLVIRLQSVITEFNEVNINQLKKELTLSNNEVSTIEL